MHDVDTAVLRTFLVLAETGSFSRTGVLVGRSQSAVSEQIRKLEQMFGRSLLVRTTRSVRLTPEGEHLLAHARAMVAQADAMLARFRAPDIAGEVRFGSPEDFASAYLPDILGVFAAAHPAIELHVTCQLTLPLVEEFEAGQQDLIIVKQDPSRRYASTRPLWRERLVWVAAPALTTDFTTASSGRLLPLVLSPSPCVYRSRATQTLEQAGVAWSGVHLALFCGPGRGRAGGTGLCRDAARHGSLRTCRAARLAGTGRSGNRAAWTSASIARRSRLGRLHRGTRGPTLERLPW